MAPDPSSFSRVKGPMVWPTCMGGPAAVAAGKGWVGTVRVERYGDFTETCGRPPRSMIVAVRRPFEGISIRGYRTDSCTGPPSGDDLGRRPAPARPDRPRVQFRPVNR